MRNHFKNRILQKKILKSNTAYKPKAVETITAVGIIIDLNLLKDFREVKVLKEAFEKGGGLGKEPVDVDTIVVPLSKDNEKAIYTDKVFSDTQLTRRGKFKEENDAKHFKEKRFDVLINYFIEASPELRLLSASVSTKLRIGLKATKNEVNDLEIDVNPANIEGFTRLLKMILPKIK